MKKFWKALGIAALAAAVPVRIKKNKETGQLKYQSLLLSVDIGPGEDGEGTDIGINLGEGLLSDVGKRIVGAKKEADMFTDNPDEAVLFADDEPEAAVVETTEASAPAPSPTPAEVVDTPLTKESADPVVTEEDFDPDL